MPFVTLKFEEPNPVTVTTSPALSCLPLASEYVYVIAIFDPVVIQSWHTNVSASRDI